MKIDTSPEALARSRAARAALLAQPLPPPEKEMPRSGEIEASPTNAQVTPQFKAEYSKSPAESARGERSKQSGTSPPGATSAEWDAFVHLALEELLPVVSNLDAAISPSSKLTGLGKVPSRYNKAGEAMGIAAWPLKVATAAEIAQWRQQPDYGICVNARLIRGIDIDIEDSVLAQDVHDEIDKFLGIKLPVRSRNNSPRILLPFKLPGEYRKRVIHCEPDGAIEFLGSGNQWVATGQHKSGARYDWKGGLPQEFPEITPEQFDGLWARLIECFAVDQDAIATSPAAVPHVSSTPAEISAAIAGDPVAKALIENGATVERGKVRIECPWSGSHTPGGDDTLIYLSAGTDGYTLGNFCCLHNSCDGRSRSDFLAAFGIEPPPAASADEFPVEVQPVEGERVARNKYVAQSLETLFSRPRPGWKIKGVMPSAAVGFIYGAFGSGKTFVALDLAFAVARGTPWRGHKVKQGAVVYLAAEDAAGVILRAEAYKIKHGLTGVPVPLWVIDASPNLTSATEKDEVLRAVQAVGEVSVLFVDTTAAVTAGADENSGKDMGLLLDYCKTLHRRTGAMVILVAHVGKDAAKGIRGWSGMGGAADFAMVVERDGDERVATVGKLKNGPDGTEYGFRLEVMPLGIDEDGDVVSSCVVEHTVAKPKAQRGGREPKGAVQKIALRVLGELSIGGPVSVNDLLEAVVAQMAPPAAGKRDARRQHAAQAVNALVASGTLTADGGAINVAGGEE